MLQKKQSFCKYNESLPKINLPVDLEIANEIDDGEAAGESQLQTK